MTAFDNKEEGVARWARLESRFITATGTPPTDSQLADLAEIKESTLALAYQIDRCLSEGRDKAIAMTALEDVLMRANRGVFSA